ncbi:MAG: hypothetical protein WA728_12385 [Xanthobacteraceae bacterium]
MSALGRWRSPPFQRWARRPARRCQDREREWPYIAGGLGTLIGADLTNLEKVKRDGRVELM